MRSDKNVSRKGVVPKLCRHQTKESELRSLKEIRHLSLRLKMNRTAHNTVVPPLEAAQLRRTLYVIQKYLGGNMFSAISASTIAIITASLSLIVSFMNNQRIKKNTYINTITSNRIDWMNKLKLYINDYIVLTKIGYRASIYNNNRLAVFEEILRKKNEIVFHLNYQGALDDKILINIDQIYDYFDILYKLIEYFESEDENNDINFVKLFMPNNDDLLQKLSSKNNTIKESGKRELLNLNKKCYKEVTTSINEYQAELIRFTQVYTKIEWNRIKREAVGFTWKGFKFWQKLTVDEMRCLSK